jgi:Secretion system C-terminal sorting domain
MKNKILVLVLVFFNVTILAQNRNSIWCFGDSAGIDFNNLNNPSPYLSIVISRGSCASISDSVGNLLLYTFNRTGIGDHSTQINNATNQIVQNGDSVIGEGNYNELILFPVPGSFNTYYLFSSLTVFPNMPGFYYCIIDMNLNGGLGEVIQKNIQLLNFDIADAVQAIKHANGRDWWVLSKLSSNNFTGLNRFFVYLISPSGISIPIIQDFASGTDLDLQKVIVNNIGNKLMHINFRGLMTEYDFDRCTGTISNPKIIYPEQTSNYNRNFWEGAYSPNDSIFYTTATWYSPVVSDTSWLIQYNLFAPNIAASADTLSWHRHPNIYGAVRLAPDGKIYMTNAYDWGFPTYPYPDSVYNQYNMNLGVINSPDSLGVACNFQPFSFYLGGKRTYVGLPNNPNYHLGTVVGSVCDSLTVGINSPSIANINSSLTVFYHPQWQTAFINAQNLKGKHAVLSVYDIAGHLIFRSSNDIINGYYTFDLELSSFSEGMYMVHLQTEKEKLVKKLIKE